MQEIEKKYLVNIMPDVSEYESSHIAQGYLKSDETGEVRIRIMDDEYFLTSKGNGSLIREELETPVSLDTLKILYSLIKGRIIEKTRVFILLPNDYVAELDIYEKDLSGLVTVEVEFPNEDAVTEFIPPYWFGEDITNDKRFKNKNLAMSDIKAPDLLSQNNKKKELK